MQTVRFINLNDIQIKLITHIILPANFLQINFIFFQKENEKVLHVKGPILIDITPEEVQEQIDLELSGQNWGPYNITTGYIVSKKRLRVNFELKSLKEVLIHLSGSVDHPQDNQTYATYKMFLPKLTDLRIQRQSTLYLQKTNFSLELLPHSPKQRLIQGYFVVKYDIKKVEARLISRAIKVTKEHFVINANYDVLPEKQSYNFRLVFT